MAIVDPLCAYGSSKLIRCLDALACLRAAQHSQIAKAFGDLWAMWKSHFPKYNAAMDLGLSHWHRWFSGRMLACHAGGPGSIPGRCNGF